MSTNNVVDSRPEATIYNALWALTVSVLSLLSVLAAFVSSFVDGNWERGTFMLVLSMYLYRIAPKRKDYK